MVKRTPSLAQPQRIPLPNASSISSTPPRKKRSSSLPPPLSNLDSVPTFTNTFAPFASPVGKTPKSAKPKPLLQSATSTALRIGNRSNSILGARVARAERIGADIRLSRKTLEKMTPLEWRIHSEKRFTSIISMMTIVDERKTAAIAKQTTIEANKDKIFRSSLLQREMDRSFLVWILTIQDPRTHWIPPFRSGALWKAYIQKEIRTGNFSLSTRVGHDWEKCWVVARDRRDALDQKKIKFVNAAARSYGAAMSAIESECVLEFSKRMDPELCFKTYSVKLVKGTGLKETISGWLSSYSIALPPIGVEALGGILEHVLDKKGISLRNDFARVWASAKALQKETQSQNDLATQPLTNILNWSV